MNLGNQGTNFFIFAFFGVGIEIIFTALKGLFNRTQNKEQKWGLVGFSSIWMFPIYGSIAFLFPPVYQLIFAWNIVFRMLIYAIAIFSVEFLSGFVLEKVLGRCPWQYESKLSLGGYIRLDYLPYWMAFGLITEFIYKVL
jgi:uncharacterized membrane protein